MKKERALIFAGAGASTAVAPAQYPTTIAFYEKIPESIKSDDLIKTIEKWFHETNGSIKSPLDIEVVLWAIEELATVLGKIESSKEFPFYALRWNLLTEWTRGHQPTPMPSVGEVVSRYPHILPSLNDLRSKINQLVYDFYSRLPSQQQLAHNWLPLLEGLHKWGFQIELATTNYDLILEQALELMSPTSKPKTGRPDRGVYRYLDLDLWRNPVRPGGLLTKLHGSVDWSYAPDGGVLVGNPQFKADHSRHVIVYPGFKGVPTTEEMILFHNYFAQAVSAADLLFFIGFAFRDGYLNELISNNTNPSAQVVVLNPTASEINLPFKGSNVELIDEKFDLGSVDHCLRLAANMNTAGGQIGAGDRVPAA